MEQYHHFLIGVDGDYRRMHVFDIEMAAKAGLKANLIAVIVLTTRKASFNERL